jgi:hypothetical protein
MVGLGAAWAVEPELEWDEHGEDYALEAPYVRRFPVLCLAKLKAHVRPKSGGEARHHLEHPPSMKGMQQRRAC